MTDGTPRSVLPPVAAVIAVFMTLVFFGWSLISVNAIGQRLPPEAQQRYQMTGELPGRLQVFIFSMVAILILAVLANLISLTIAIVMRHRLAIIASMCSIFALFLPCMCGGMFVLVQIASH